jgi:hypothetical protein
MSDLLTSQGWIVQDIAGKPYVVASPGNAKGSFVPYPIGPNAMREMISELHSKIAG